MAREVKPTSIVEVAKRVPWDAEHSDQAYAATRRVASTLQARAYFVSMVLERKPTNTMSEGIVGMLLATNTVLFEEIVLGHLRFSAGRRIRQSGAGGLLKICESENLLGVTMAGRVRRMLDARNAFIHADRDRVLPSNSPRLTTRSLWPRTHHAVPEAVAAELRVLHARSDNVSRN